MLKRHHQILQTILGMMDAASTAAALALAYLLRFRSGIFPVPRGIPPPEDYLPSWPVAVAIALIAYRYHGLYEPKRIEGFRREVLEILKATATAVVGIVLVTFFVRSPAESRGVLVLFAACNLVLLATTRGSVRLLLWSARRRGYNQRYAVIIGAGKLGQAVAERLHGNPWMGIQVLGFVEAREARRSTVRGLPVLGTVEDLGRILATPDVDQVYVALPLARYKVLRAVLDRLSREAVAVRLVPDLPGVASLQPTLDDLDGLPVLGLRESPVYGLHQVAKRALDLAVASIALVAFAPVMGIVALAVRLTSPGPIFFAQERMGLDGRRFEMLKFRTMRDDAEAQTGAVWATAEDARVTPVGRFLRRTSLDELPQLLNVLRGEMSIVGPRPERPVLIERFKYDIPRYMHRHAVKAGITGWAQVNGWRGNTSLRKRLQYDLYYVQNWSLGFDLKIMALTLFKGFIHRNAY